MADSFTGNINLRKPEVGSANDTWGGVAGLNADLDILDAIFLYTGLSTVAPPTGHPLAGVPGVGLRIGKGMVLNVEGQVQHKDPTDITKVGTFSMDLIPTATTVDLKYPPAPGTIATKEILVATVQASHPVGTILSGYYGPTPPSGYVFVDGRTIGDASSGATNRANADCERLFTHLWTIMANAQCPVLPGGRGATAAADFAAHKTITLPDHSGAAMAGRDDLSGTNRNRLTPGMAGATTRGTVGGAATEAASVSGSCSVNVSGGISGTASGTLTGSVSGTTTGDGGSGGYVRTGDPVSVSGSLGVGGSFSGSGSGSISGATASVTNVQTTIVVDVVMAL